MPGSGDAQTSRKCAKGRPEDDNYQKTPRDGEAQERARRKHNGRGQDARDWRHDLPRDQQVPVCRLRPAGEVGGSRNGGGRTEPIRKNQQGLTGILATSREDKGGD